MTNKPRKVTLGIFISELADLIRPMMEADMVWQDDLFEMQEKICELIAEGANSNCGAAQLFTKKWPEFFETTTESK
tara:strand:+ start:173 stop:400 length:228 start_codon:yes stop_codon:yes gene_type:complete